MNNLQSATRQKAASSKFERKYAELLEQSKTARARGKHWEAQQYATAAHKLAMDERTRLQRLQQARTELEAATRQLNVAWDKDRDCETVEELLEQHPEFKRVITAWQKARQQVIDLDEPTTPEGIIPEQKNSFW